MKKLIPFYGIVLFPYLIVFILISIFGGYFTDDFLLFLLITLIILYVVAIVCAIAEFIKGITKKNQSTEILRINMMIKLLHIPAYLLIFVFGLLCTITIFTIGVTIVLMILDGMTILLSGLVGLGGIIGSLRENKISTKKAVIHGILQFIYCADVISSIVMYRTVKASQ
jgi:MFS family permease